MNAQGLLANLAQLNIRLVADGDVLRFYPRAAVPHDLLEQMRQHKSELLTRLSAAKPDTEGFTTPKVTELGIGGRGNKVAVHQASGVAGGTEAPTVEGLTVIQDPPRFTMIRDPAALAYVPAVLQKHRLIGLDLETTGLDPREDRVRLLSIAVAGDDEPESFVIDCFALGYVPLLEVLAGKSLVIHNAAFDLGFLTRMGLVPGVTHDTMLMAQLLTAGTLESCKLGDCCQRYLGLAIDKGEQRSDWTGELSGSQLAYAARDAAVLLPLYQVLKDQIDRDGMGAAAALEERTLPALVWLANQGVACDKSLFRQLAETALQDAGRLGTELNGIAPSHPDGKTWNWRSPVQIRQVLNMLECGVKDTKDETLATVDHPFARTLRQYRAAAQRASTFGEDWLANVHGDGRVYASWRQIGAASGRMSCSKPNLQQLPRGAYRQCLVAPPGRVLIKADYSQIELRIAAKISGDQALLQAYLDGGDLHTATARSVLGRGGVTKQDRQLAKALNFGLLFGMGARTFQRYAQTDFGLRLTTRDARRYRDAFFTTYAGLADWQNKVRLQGGGETRTIAGRRRLLDASTPYTHRLNSPVQGTGADGLKGALALLWERRGDFPAAFPVLTVHDEIVLEAPEDQAGHVAAWLRQAMLDGMAPFLQPVPVAVEVKVGRSWGAED